MNDIMKIVGIVAVLFGIWKFTNGDLSKLPFIGGSKPKSSYSESSSPGAPKPKSSSGSQQRVVTQAELQAAKQRYVQAQKALAALQNSSAGAATQDRNVEYHDGYRHTTTLTYTNSGVNARSAAIKQAQQNLAAAQLAYAEAQREYTASKKK